MHRFGRSASKWKDRWAANFLLAAALAIVAGYLVGEYLDNRWQDQPATGEQPPGLDGNRGEGAQGPIPAPPLPADGMALTGEGQGPSLYVLQVGVFGKADNAKRLAERLAREGFPAWASADAPYRVLAGAFAGKAGAQEAADRLQAAGFETYTHRQELSRNIPVLATGAGSGTDLRQGLASLEQYIQEAAGYWDAQAVGQSANTDRLARAAEELEAAATRLRSQSAEAAVSRFIDLAAKAAHNAQQVQAHRASGQVEDAQVAMAGYLELIDAYGSGATMVP